MPGTDNRQAILSAARLWVQRCLLEGGSVFGPAPLWTRRPLEDLKKYFVDQADLSDRSFIDKLRDQLAPASPSAKQLAAEMLWVMMLFPARIGADKKREIITEVWSWSGSKLPESHPLLIEPLIQGIGSGGTSYNNRRWAELKFLIEFVRDWVTLDRNAQRALVESPFGFARFLDHTPGADRRQLRHMLLFMLFPDHFQRVSSSTQRRAIAQHYAALVAPDDAAARPEPEDSPMIALDRQLFAIRSRLAREKGRSNLDFYDPDIKVGWQSESPPDDEMPRRGTLIELRTSLQRILDRYGEARQSERFGASSSISGMFRAAQRSLEESAVLESHPQVRVKWSAGRGNWSSIPWIALLDSRETDSTQRGVYCVFLFAEDLSGVYLTLNQGVTDPLEKLGRVAGLQKLRDTVTSIRSALPTLADAGFATDDQIDLRATGSLGANYEESTIAYKWYSRASLPDADDLGEDLGALLTLYGQVVDQKSHPAAQHSARTWIFQANPTLFDIRSALGQLNSVSWLTRQFEDEIRVGDAVFVWESGPDGGIMATARVTEPPMLRDMPPPERPFVRDTAKFAGAQLRTVLAVTRALSPHLSRERIRETPALSDLQILRAPQGTNFRVSRQQAAVIEDLIGNLDKAENQRVVAAAPLTQVVRDFSQALSTAHISFGARHDDVVRAFIASLVTKRFCILAGLSGSGKTQLALKLGEWFGPDRYLAVPVRPDWTGPEAVFGFEDALIPPIDNKRAWHTPIVLEFVLRARADLQHPHLLLLDEMNLAHVERYFADFLSAMESGEPCVPALSFEDGFYRVPVDRSLRFGLPDNLFVVGTVNIDETTYMFSPKVLDRAHTIEFRVETDELSPNAPRPIACTAGGDASVRGFLSVARDGDWHITNHPPFRERFVSLLHALHRLLSSYDLEFGHRSFSEACRFASAFYAAGGGSCEAALDLVLLQKVLPRLHGPRRRLEPPLVELAGFAERLEGRARSAEFESAGESSSPQLPVSHRKIQRMLSRLRTDQFASFLA